MRTPFSPSGQKGSVIALGAMLVGFLVLIAAGWSLDLRAESAGRPCIHCGPENFHEFLRPYRAFQNISDLMLGLAYYNSKKQVHGNMLGACENHFLANEFTPALETGAPIDFGPCEQVGHVYPVPGGSGIPYYMSRTGVSSFGAQYTDMPYSLQWKHLSPYHYTPGGLYRLSRSSDGNFTPVRNTGNFGVRP